MIFISHSFWESGNGEQLSSVIVPQGMSWSCTQAVDRGCRHLRTRVRAGKSSKISVRRRSQFLAIWASLVTHDMAAGFLQGYDTREKEWWIWNWGVFYNLILQKMYYHFCYILFVDVGMNYIAVWLSVGYLGAILEVGHHTFYNFNYFGWESGKIFHDLPLLVLLACFSYDNI